MAKNRTADTPRRRTCGGVIGAALVLPMVLAACGGGASFATYELSAPRTFPADARVARASLLVVAEPQTLALLNTERIVVQGPGGDLAYIPGVQWSDRLPRLLQAKIIQSFENANRIRAVGRPGERLAADAQLVTEVRTFALRVADAPVAEVEISAKIVGDRSGRIIAARVFRATAAAGGLEGPLPARALDEALDRVLVDLVGWTAGRI